MTVTFFSNILHHHQIPFCDEMYKRLGSGFNFVSTEDMPDFLLKGGYKDCSNDYPYNINSHRSKNEYDKAMKLGLESDIVIIGSAPEMFVKERLRLNKHTFRCCERPLKQGKSILFRSKALYFFWKNHIRYRKKNLYMLCASAYTATDYSFLKSYPNKMFKWGYFTEVKELDIDEIILQKETNKINLLWTARFLSWKHPELPVLLAERLKNKGYSFQLKMIGGGVLYSQIENLIREKNLQDCVTLIGNMPNSDVLQEMQKSHIFLFTSDRNEGWGAVLNEAMSSGCAVVASHMIGAAPFLIEHNKNGLIFESENIDDLEKKVKLFIGNQLLREKYSKEAYNSMKMIWSPNNAAYSFLNLANNILSRNYDSQTTNGPCSYASYIFEKYNKESYNV